MPNLPMLRRAAALAVLFAVADLAAASEPDAENADAPQSVSFRADVAPILVRQCLACHGPNDAKGDFQLHTFTALDESGYVVAGDLESSELFNLVTTDDVETRMPKDGNPLTEEQVAAIRSWIESGAQYDADDPAAPLATIVPRTPHPTPPDVYTSTVPVSALAFTPDGSQIAVGGYHEVTLWNSTDGTLVRRISDVPQRVFDLQLNRDGTTLALAGGTPGESGEASLVDVATGELLRTFITSSDVIFDVEFHPDGNSLATAAADRSIRIFDVESAAQKVLIEDHADWVLGIAFNADGTLLVSASRDKTSKLFNAETGEAQVTYPGHGNTVFDAAFSSNGSAILSAGADRKIHLWNPADAKKTAEIAGYGRDVHELIVVPTTVPPAEGAESTEPTPGHDEIFSVSADAKARLHAGEKRELVRAFEGHSDWIYSAAYHHPTRRLATGAYDGEVRLWNVDDGQLITQFVAAPGLAATDQTATAQ